MAEDLPFVDTNIFVRHFRQDHADHSPRATAFLTRIESGQERARTAEEKGLAALVDFQLKRWFADRTHAEQPALIDQAKRVFLANDVAGYAASCRALGAMDLRGKVDGIQCPTLIVVGDEDYATPPSMAEDLHRRIGGSELVVLPSVRHLSAWEAADVVNGHIDRLLARLG